MAAGIIGILAGLVVDTAYSWARMFIALGFSVVIGIAIGIWAALSRGAERVILPVVDILQTLPILAFFPFVIFVVVATLPGAIGINAAVVFLIVTSMLWNIIFGAYEAVKLLPSEFTELSSIYKMGTIQKLRKIFIPATLPGVVEQSVLSWSIGLFYLVTSEIFSTGNANYQVTHGIGVALTQYAVSGNTLAYALGILVFIAFVVLTRLLFFRPLERYFEEKKIKKQPQHKRQAHRPWWLPSFRSSMLERRFISYAKNEGRVLTGFIRKRGDERPSIAGKVKEAWRKEALVLIGFICIVAVLLWATGLMGYEIQALQALVYSFLRVWFAFIVAAVIAVPVCVYLIFRAKRTSGYVLLFQILASIPATIILPEIVVLFRNVPNGAEITAFLVFLLSGIWYLIFSILSSSKSIPENIFEVKKVFDIKGREAWRKIYLMAILPGLITGGITAIAAEWNASIVAEYFSASSFGVNIGIGKLLDVSVSNGNLLLMGVALLNLTIMIIILNTFVWKRLYNKASDVYK